MSNATIYTKALTSGNEKVLILEPGQAFQRQTNFPANWQIIRAAILFSVCDTSGPNTTPITEMISDFATLKAHMLFGMSNGVAFPGEAGNRYVGMKDTAGPRIDFNNPNWRIRASNSNNLDIRDVTADGTSVTQSTYNTGAPIEYGDPTGLDANIGCLAIQLNVSVAAKLRVYMVPTGISNLSSAKDSVISGFLTGSSYTEAGNNDAGWWSAGGNPDPVGCTHLLFRCPLLNNRIRIHNIMAIQVA